MLNHTIVLVIFAVTLCTISTAAAASDAKFGPSNPFYAPSTLPFQAPPFDKIKDEDYQPAIEAGMAEELIEVQAIADNPAAPTFENTLVAMEKTGLLFQRALAAFGAVSGANTNPLLQKVRTEEAPKLAAHADAIYLNTKLFARVSAVYQQRDSLKLDAESLRLLEVTYDRFVRSGANLSDADKTDLKKLNQEISTLEAAFSTKLLAATKDGAYATGDR
ncbi:MAG: dipeptidyl carboxypeptidase II, partial [Terriglobales bacterium]